MIEDSVIIHCAICSGPVDRIVVIRNDPIDYRIFLDVHCHGETKRYRVYRDTLHYWAGHPLTAFTDYDTLQPPLQQIKPAKIVTE